MRLFWGISQTLIASLVVVLAAQPVWAAKTAIANVLLQRTSSGLEIVLSTQSGDSPQIFTLSRGNSWIVEITNAQLKLPQGNSFHGDNPAPGISSVTIIPLSDNSVQIIVTRLAGSLTGEVTRRDSNSIVLSLSLESASIAEEPKNRETNSQLPITNSPSPVPFVPLAIAPPVGDIAVSNINISPTSIDLGTNERIPRLILRKASVREVLTLLANTVGFNIIFIEDTVPPRTQPTSPAEAEALTEPVISMEIQNESIQNVFNYVLQMSRLQANRVGNTILIGRNLPADARGLVMRTVRLNQLKATLPESPITTTITSGSSLNSGGGGGTNSTNSLVSRTSTTTRNIPFRGALQALEALGANEGGQQVAAQPPGTPPLQRSNNSQDQLLNGLQVIADSRTNTVTLIGPLRLVEMATNYLMQLDVRRRQVAVNVKIIEVNLSNEENIGASFSFGIADSFFSVTQGSANANFGRINPQFINTNPLQNPGALFSPTIIETPNIARPFQFARQFLLNLQAQVVSGNAKILTDPTLIVQEGSHSQVNLTTQVFAGFRQITEAAPGNQTRTVSETKEPIDVGVILNIAVDQIDDNGFITMFVSPEVSSPGTAITDPSRNDLLIQQLVNRRRLETGSIRLRDGQTLILTGIIQEQDRNVTTKTPFLGDIPLIGALFRSTRSERNRSEIIVLVTPNIMDDSAKVP